MPQEQTHSAGPATHAPAGVSNQAGTVAHGGQGQHGGGFPQLNAHDFAPQLVWLVITFGLLYWIMSRIALPRIADSLEKRRDRIASDIDTAKRHQQEAEQAGLAYKAALAEAKAKAHGIAQDTKDSLAAKTEAKRLEVEGKIAAKLAEAEQRIGASKQAAMAEVGNIATDTTKEIVSRLIGVDIADNELADAVKAAGSH